MSKLNIQFGDKVRLKTPRSIIKLIEKNKSENSVFVYRKFRSDDVFDSNDDRTITKVLEILDKQNREFVIIGTYKIDEKIYYKLMGTNYKHDFLLVRHDCITKNLGSIFNSVQKRYEMFLKLFKGKFKKLKVTETGDNMTIASTFDSKDLRVKIDIHTQDNFSIYFGLYVKDVIVNKISYEELNKLFIDYSFEQKDRFTVTKFEVNEFNILI